MTTPHHPTWTEVAALIISQCNVDDHETACELLKEMAGTADLYNHIAQNESSYNESVKRCACYLLNKKEEDDFIEHITDGNKIQDHVYYHAANVINQLNQLPNPI